MKWRIGLYLEKGDLVVAGQDFKEALKEQARKKTYDSAREYHG